VVRSGFVNLDLEALGKINLDELGRKMAWVKQYDGYT
jgi:hypothetical protein